MSESKVVPVALPVKLEMGQSALADTGDYSAYILIKDANGETIISWYDADADDEEADAKAQFIVDAINAHAPSADQGELGELAKVVAGAAAAYKTSDDIDNTLSAKLYRAAAALQSVEASRKDAEHLSFTQNGNRFEVRKPDGTVLYWAEPADKRFVTEIKAELSGFVCGYNTAIDAAIAGKTRTVAAYGRQ